MQLASTRRTTEVVRSADRNAPVTPPREPSWGRVLATTISLWTARRIPRLRRPGLALFLAFVMLVTAAAVVAVVQLTTTPARTAPSASPHRAAPRAGGPPAAGAEAAGPEAAGSGAAGSGVTGTAAGIRAQAAAWVAAQVGSDQSIACDPVMCAALGAHGIASGRLMPLRPGTNAATVAVTSAADHAQDGTVPLASFGTGSRQVEVRAAAPGGTAAYAKARAADLAARRSGGAQLLHSKSIQAGAEATAQLQAGQVDSRIRIMLAMLASQHSWRVVAFGGSSPGVAVADAPVRRV